jgi:hypothetical protein
MRRDPLGTSAQHLITSVRSSILTRRACAGINFGATGCKLEFLQPLTKKMIDPIYRCNNTIKTLSDRPVAGVYPSSVAPPDLRSGQYPDLFGTLFMKEIETHYTHSVHWSLPSCKYTAPAAVHQTYMHAVCLRGSPVSGIVHKSSWTFELLQSQHLFSCIRQPSADHRLHIVSSFVLDEPAHIQPDWMDARICTGRCRSGQPDTIILSVCQIQ